MAARVLARQVLRSEGDVDPRWIVLTLELRTPLVGTVCNVRETRATPGPHGELRAVDDGRWLHWIGTDRHAAQRLMASRVRGLLVAGWRELDLPTDGVGRGRWDWLRDLAVKALDVRAQRSRERLFGAAATGAGAAGYDADAPHRDGPARGEPTPDDDSFRALRAAIHTVGVDPDELCEQLAAALGVDLHTLRNPSREALRRVDVHRLAPVLELLLAHGDRRLRTIAADWFAVPAIAFELPACDVARWLERDEAPADWLRPQLRAQGLALLGPTQLRAVAARSSNPVTRAALASWVTRLAQTAGAMGARQ